MGRQGQPREAQLHAMYLSERKGWSQDPPLPRIHLSIGSGHKGILLEIPAYLRSSEGKQLLSLISVSMAVAFEQTHLLQPRTVLLCCCCCAFHCVTPLHYSVCIAFLPDVPSVYQYLKILTVLLISS